MLKGKTAIITGGSRGIGKEIAFSFAAQGANVAILYASSEKEAEEACRICREDHGVLAESYRCDVSRFDEVKRTVGNIRDRFGNIHILVNNAGIARDGLAIRMTEEAFDRVLDTNLKGAFHMIRHVLPVFVKNREGCIVNISSISGLMGNRGQSNYAASKAGLIGMTKAIAKEYASRNIRCNAVAPGYIRTEMTQGLAEEDLLRQIPLGRTGRPEDVAQAVLFLARAAYITGETIRVDGGMAM